MDRDRIEQAQLAYENAVFGGDSHGVASAERALDELEADVALARGRLLHARFLDQVGLGGVNVAKEQALFQRALELYQALGDSRGVGEALFWLGCFMQVVEDDDAAAVPLLERAVQHATDADDMLTVSYALRHLGMAEHRAGRLTAAGQLLEQSTDRRRSLGFHAGVAANLIGLAYVAAGEEQRDRVEQLLDEAAAITLDHAPGLANRVDAARSELLP